jgi:hypothetical protein
LRIENAEMVFDIVYQMELIVKIAYLNTWFSITLQTQLRQQRFASGCITNGADGILASKA